MEVEDLLGPILMVVGEMLYCLEEDLVQVLTSLAAAVFPPPVHNYAVWNVH
jgi:hypothetical protein